MAEFGALSSLGVGSGVLTYDIIDKLRKADEKSIIEPLDSRIDTLKKKEEELNTIVTKTAALKSSVLDLSDTVFLAKRTVDVTGDGIDVSVLDGISVQEIDVTVNQLAKAQIDQSKGFADRSSVVSTVDTSMTIAINGNSYTIDIAAGTTLEELMNLINDNTGGDIKASILNTGGTDPYSLIVKSSATGADQSISYSYSGTDFLSMTNVQLPQDAQFIYNGVSITRSSNVVEDLVTGMTLTLKKADSASVNHVSIKQDNEAIADAVQSFVDAFNDFYGELSTATKFDTDTGTAGIFQGESTLNALRFGVGNIVSGMTTAGGLPDVGITIDRYGNMSFDRTELISALQQDSQKVSDIFAGNDNAPGLFAQLNSYLKDQTIGSDATLNRFEDLLQSQLKRTEESKSAKIEFLDTKYQIMAQQFADYDRMIQQFNASFASLQSVIEAQAAAAKK